MPVLRKWINEAWMTAYLFTTLVAQYFKSTMEIYCSERKIPFKILLLIDETSKSLMEKYNEIHVIFMDANTVKEYCMLQINL